MPASSCFLVVQGNRARAVQMVSDLRKACPGSQLRQAQSLSEAHSLSEQENPDLVVLDQDFLEERGLAVFISMLSALAIDWLVVYDKSPSERLPARRQVPIDGLKSHLQQNWQDRPDQVPGKAAGTGLRAPDQPGAHPAAPNSMRPAPQQLKTKRATPQGARTGERPFSAASHGGWRTVVIGASTGGIEALIAVLSHFPAHGPPTLVVQHINGAFIPGLADRLDRLCGPKVRAAQNNDTLRPGEILIAPGDTQHLILSDDGRRCLLQDGPPQSGHRPSVDALFASAARALGGSAVGIILSGMGRDGASGLLAMRQQGGWTIGQNKDTCVVYGMPRAASETGALEQELPLPQIGPAALTAASKSPPSSAARLRTQAEQKTFDA